MIHYKPEKIKSGFQVLVKGLLLEKDINSLSLKINTIKKDKKSTKYVKYY